MRAFNKKVLVVYGFMITYIIYKILSSAGLVPAFNNYINVAMWFTVALISYFLTKNDYNRYLQSSDKSQVTFIIVLMYLMIYFMCGLITGYQHNAYSLTLSGILMNTFTFMTVIVFQEYLRQVLVNYSGGKMSALVFITLLFILISLNYGSLPYEFSNGESGFKYICSTLLPLCVSNMVFTYLTLISSYRPALIYRLLTTAYSIYLPILPNINWFYSGLCGILVPAIIYVVINYSHTKLVTKMTRAEEKESKPTAYIPALLFTIVVMAFVLGFFKYQPVAVVSNSMYPFFERGDVVIIEKLEVEEMDRIKKGDVIKFAGEGYYVVHRVVDISEDEKGELLFTTKGDYNNTVDFDKVPASKVEGIYLTHVKYLGFPSVWLSEALR